MLEWTPTPAGSAPSTEDYLNVNYKNPTLNFSAIIETTSKRYAIVITNVEDYKAFADSKKLKEHQEGLNNATRAGLKTAATTFIANGGKRENFDENAAILEAQQKYLNDNKSGLSIYQTDDKDKINFKKL